MDNRVYIFDTTLRDGEQVPGCQLNAEEKIVVARELELLGVDVIEAGFPISSPGDFQSVVNISKAVSEPVVCALSRAVKADIACAAEALQYAKRKRIHTGIGSSDMHIQYKFGSSREKVLDRAAAAAKYARNFTDDVEFYCEDAGRADLPFLAQMVETVIAAGATVVNIPDTTGYCLPDQYGNIFEYLMNQVPNIDKAILSAHCHNDLGMATANTVSALRNGARQAEVTINGIGERAGNTSLEETVMTLRAHYESIGLTTGIDTTKIFPTSKLITRLMRMPVQPNKAIVGRNAFAHSSGIHQDGVLKNRENYEIIDPADVGVPSSSIILTARSGKAAVKHRFEKLGIELDQEELAGVYPKFLELADEQKQINDEDLLELIGRPRTKNSLKLESLQVTCGKDVEATAQVTISKNKKNFYNEAKGNGPVDATIKAIDTIFNLDVNLAEYLVQAITGGSNDVAQVHIQVDKDGIYYYGFGTDPDTVTATAKAYIDALSKL